PAGKSVAAQIPPPAAVPAANAAPPVPPTNTAVPAGHSAAALASRPSAAPTDRTVVLPLAFPPAALPHVSSERSNRMSELPSGWGRCSAGRTAPRALPVGAARPEALYIGIAAISLGKVSPGA